MPSEIVQSNAEQSFNSSQTNQPSVFFFFTFFFPSLQRMCALSFPRHYLLQLVRRCTFFHIFPHFYRSKRWQQQRKKQAAAAATTKITVQMNGIFESGDAVIPQSIAYFVSFFKLGMIMVFETNSLFAFCAIYIATEIILYHVSNVPNSKSSSLQRINF